MKFGLTDQQFQILDKIAIAPLKSHGATVWIFGSRARGDHKAFSDIDLMYETIDNSPLPVGFISILKETLEESSLPFKVDLVDLKELAESYRSNALADRTRI
jgi:predicted nucleotidyltransferase